MGQASFQWLKLVPGMVVRDKLLDYMCWYTGQLIRQDVWLQTLQVDCRGERVSLESVPDRVKEMLSLSKFDAAVFGGGGFWPLILISELLTYSRSFAN